MMPGFRNIILGLAMLYCPLIFSQANIDNSENKDYQKFKGTLQKEIQQEAKDTISGKQILHPASLPDWLFYTPTSDGNILYSIGISDPGMPEKKAFQLAALRAKSVIAFLLHPKITGITDNYSKEYSAGSADKFTTKYENLFQISSNLFVSENNTEQIEGFYTSFGEAIVLLKYNITGVELIYDSALTLAEVYQVERQKNNVFETEEKITVDSHPANPGDTALIRSYTYSIHTLNNLLEINSQMNGEAIMFPYFNFRYLGIEEKEVAEPENNLSAKLNYGLWKTYIETLVQKILFLSQSYSVAIKQVGDDYSTENKNLSREISEADPSFKISGLRITNNYLSVDVDYLNNSK
jgi:hypothetical protein